ncbi:hypothetical protein [Humibacter sp. RRB41]|uniref:hypothetical protein n=1 Tax=Humibacter sp. RRB41 TaxID=2919946 RepID=UPI001FAA16BE|nr:hypothetical protein [Humibacter sp. RRB41]
MNTQTLDTRTSTTVERAAETQGRSSHPPSPLDRLAMRVGLALVLWSRREHRAPSREEVDRSRAVRLNTVERERLARERAWQAGVDSLSRR